MKEDILKQEILLVISTFSHNDLCEKNEVQHLCHPSHAEQLEEACWNGLLDELLIGIIDRSVSGERLSLWHIQQANSFLEIELCNYPQLAEKHFSIDPYVFLALIPQN
jgi:hypothetical protein